MILVKKVLIRCSTIEIIPSKIRIGLRNHNFNGAGNSIKRNRSLLVGTNIWVGVLPEWMVILHVIIRATI